MSWTPIIIEHPKTVEELSLLLQGDPELVALIPNEPWSRELMEDILEKAPSIIPRTIPYMERDLFTRIVNNNPVQLVDYWPIFRLCLDPTAMSEFLETLDESPHSLEQEFFTR